MASVSSEDGRVARLVCRPSSMNAKEFEVVGELEG